MQLQLTVEERNLIVGILQERERITRKKGLLAERQYVSGLLHKITQNDYLGINECEFLKFILENTTPDELVRSYGTHDVAREREILAQVITKLSEAHVVA